MKSPYEIYKLKIDHFQDFCGRANLSLFQGVSMEFGVLFYTVSIIAILLTGISKSGFGGGLGVMAVPLMSLFVAPQFAAAVMMPILIAMDILIVWRFRHTWSRKIVLGLLPAALFGLVIGSLAFEHMNADVVRFLIGVLAAFFVIQFLANHQKKDTPTKTAQPIVWALGCLSGFSSFIAHAGGPPVKGYLLQQKLEKSWFVGTNTVFFFSLNFIKILAYGASGILTYESLRISALLAPILVVGIFIGAKLHIFVAQNIFVNIVYGFLAMTAFKLLYDSAIAFL